MAGSTSFSPSALLPTYDVFDEMRTFAPAPVQRLVCIGGESIALTICEDAWNDKAFWSRRLYDCDPVDELIRAGGRLVLNISASPFHVGKPELRKAMLASIARHHKVPVLLVNQVGGNDSLVFDGSSLALNPSGEIIAQAKSFEEDLILVDTAAMSGEIHERISGVEESAYAALVLGTRDYVRKCGFKKVVVGLSGGIDSALTAVIAVDALGKENVIGISMPSQYSSEGSVTDARALAENLGICFDVVGIRDIFESYRSALSGVFRGLAEDVTEENLQARARGGLLMAVANKFSALVLTTGNKSELGVGYCTLYGDMVGGLAVISDVPKTLVYRLARYVNSRRALIPEASITKPPSAELRPEQKDSDSLPPYDVLDRVLEEYVGNLKSAPEIVALTGFDEEVVRLVIRLIDGSEYKRQQAAPGIRISTKAFGLGRRLSDRGPPSGLVQTRELYFSGRPRSRMIAMRSFLKCSAVLLLSVSLFGQAAEKNPAPKAAATSKADTAKASPSEGSAPEGAPTAAMAEAYFKRMFGYDPNLQVKVLSIGVSPIPEMYEIATVFITPDGQRSGYWFISKDLKHAIAGDILPFGADPFAHDRAELAKSAFGASSGPADAKLLIVEFADLECPACKEAAPVLERLRSDFPQARFVFQSFPLPQLHPWAVRAASYLDCMARSNPEHAMTFIGAIFDHQKDIENAVRKTGPDGKTTVDDAAVTERLRYYVEWAGAISGEDPELRRDTGNRRAHRAQSTARAIDRHHGNSHAIRQWPPDWESRCRAV